MGDIKLFLLILFIFTLLFSQTPTILETSDGELVEDTIQHKTQDDIEHTYFQKKIFIEIGGSLVYGNHGNSDYRTNYILLQPQISICSRIVYVGSIIQFSSDISDFESEITLSLGLKIGWFINLKKNIIPFADVGVAFDLNTTKYKDDNSKYRSTGFQIPISAGIRLIFGKHLCVNLAPQIIFGDLDYGTVNFLTCLGITCFI